MKKRNKGSNRAQRRRYAEYMANSSKAKNKDNMRAPEYKPLLFTAVRNPQRLKGLLHIFLKFDGQILTDNLATKVVLELIKYGLYRPNKQNDNIKNKWKDTPKGQFAKYILSNEEIDYLKINNPQNHKEAGFAHGYPSRFATIFDFTKELGFVYFEPNKAIEFSETGKLYTKVLSVEVSQEGK
jgi:hypothetical protein